MIKLSLVLLALLQAAAPQTEISKERQNVLKENFGKRYQVISTLEGDFNSDGQKDLVVILKTATGDTRLVALLARVTESAMIEMDSLEGGGQPGTLTVIPRGMSYKDPDDKLPNYLAADAVLLTRPGQPRAAYLWNGLSFRKVIVPSVP